MHGWATSFLPSNRSAGFCELVRKGKTLKVTEMPQDMRDNTQGGWWEQVAAQLLRINALNWGFAHMNFLERNTAVRLSLRNAVD
jgi:hypothetical protein